LGKTKRNECRMGGGEDHEAILEHMCEFVNLWKGKLDGKRALREGRIGKMIEISSG
jgi:hypothetical protein